MKAASYLNKLFKKYNADEQFVETAYNCGCLLIETGKYEDAIILLNKCPDYKDAGSKVNDAKFEYAKLYKTHSGKDIYVYEYLKDLVDVGYPGAKSLYKELFTWKATVEINYGASSVKWNEETDVEVRIVAGEPGVIKRVRARVTLPNGEVITSANEWVDVSATGSFGFYWDKGVWTGPINGTLTVRVYDSDGNLLGSSSIKITSPGNLTSSIKSSRLRSNRLTISSTKIPSLY